MFFKPGTPHVSRYDRLIFARRPQSVAVIYFPDLLFHFSSTLFRYRFPISFFSQCNSIWATTERPGVCTATTNWSPPYLTATNPADIDAHVTGYCIKTGGEAWHCVVPDGINFIVAIVILEISLFFGKTRQSCHSWRNLGLGWSLQGFFFFLVHLTLSCTL